MGRIQFGPLPPGFAAAVRVTCAEFHCGGAISGPCCSQSSRLNLSNVMATRSRSASAPLTFDLSLSLIGKIDSLRRKHGLKTASEVVRHAIDAYDFEACAPVRDPHRQVSVRLTSAQRAMLKRYARKKDVSVGELLRFALEGLSLKPARAR
jgi:hypothetical protein